MKWEADQSVGIFGWSVVRRQLPDGRTDSHLSPRYFAQVDIDAALNDPFVVRVGEIWRHWSAWQETGQPFRGAVYDDWPAALTDGLVICRTEAFAINEVLRFEGHG